MADDKGVIWIYGIEKGRLPCGHKNSEEITAITASAGKTWRIKGLNELSLL